MTDQQQQMSPGMRTFMAALDGVLAEAMQDIMGRMHSQHVRWHKDMKNEPSSGCHACVLIGLAKPPEPVVQSPHALDSATPTMDNGAPDPFPNIP